MPPDYLQSLLFSIEETTLTLHEEFPNLGGRDIEWAFEQLGKYYRGLASGKQLEEPLSDSDKRQALVDELLNVIDLREEMKLDAPFINNPNIKHGEHLIRNLPHLYMIAFKRLLKSAQMWRKEGGKNGYVNYIKPFINGMKGE